MQTIAILGSESTGKTALVNDLSVEYDAIIINEYARDFLNKKGANWTQEDIYLIAMKQQKDLEIAFKKKEKDWLFLDTELICIKVWLEFYGFEVPAWITKKIVTYKADLYLLMNIDLPWVADSQRQNPHDRTVLFEKFITELKHFNCSFEIISGIGRTRTQQAIDAINQLSND